MPCLGVSVGTVPCPPFSASTGDPRGTAPLPEPRAQLGRGHPRACRSGRGPVSRRFRAELAAGPGGRRCPLAWPPTRRPAQRRRARKLGALSVASLGPALGRGTGRAGRPEPVASRPTCTGLRGSHWRRKVCGPTNQDSWGWELRAPWACTRPAWPLGGSPVLVALARGSHPPSGAERDDKPLGWPAGAPGPRGSSSAGEPPSLGRPAWRTGRRLAQSQAGPRSGAAGPGLCRGDPAGSALPARGRRTCPKPDCGGVPRGGRASSPGRRPSPLPPPEVKGSGPLPPTGLSFLPPSLASSA